MLTIFATIILCIILNTQEVREFLSSTFEPLIRPFTRMRDFKKLLNEKKAQGKYKFSVSYPNTDSFQVSIINYLDKKGLEYHMFPSANYKQVNFEIILGGTNKVISRSENIVEVKFGKASQTSGLVSAKVIPFRKLG